MQGWRDRGPGGQGLPPWYRWISADQLTLSQLGGADYAPHISTRPSRFSNLPPSLNVITIKTFTRDKIDATNKRQKVDVSWIQINIIFWANLYPFLSLKMKRILITFQLKILSILLSVFLLASLYLECRWNNPMWKRLNLPSCTKKLLCKLSNGFSGLLFSTYT